MVSLLAVGAWVLVARPNEPRAKPRPTASALESTLPPGFPNPGPAKPLRTSAYLQPGMARSSGIQQALADPLTSGPKLSESDLETLQTSLFDGANQPREISPEQTAEAIAARAALVAAHAARSDPDDLQRETLDLLEFTSLACWAAPTPREGLQAQAWRETALRAVVQCYPNRLRPALFELNHRSIAADQLAREVRQRWIPAVAQLGAVADVRDVVAEALPTGDMATARDLLFALLAGHRKEFDPEATVAELAALVQRVIDGLDEPWPGMEPRLRAIDRRVVAIFGARLHAGEWPSAPTQADGLVARSKAQAAPNPLGALIVADLLRGVSTIVQSAYIADSREAATGWAMLKTDAPLPIDPLSGVAFRPGPRSSLTEVGQAFKLVATYSAGASALPRV